MRIPELQPNFGSYPIDPTGHLSAETFQMEQKLGRPVAGKTIFSTKLWGYRIVGRPWHRTIIPVTVNEKKTMQTIRRSFPESPAFQEKYRRGGNIVTLTPASDKENQETLRQFWRRDARKCGFRNDKPIGKSRKPMNYENPLNLLLEERRQKYISEKQKLVWHLGLLTQYVDTLLQKPKKEIPQITKDIAGYLSSFKRCVGLTARNIKDGRATVIGGKDTGEIMVVDDEAKWPSAHLGGSLREVQLEISLLSTDHGLLGLIIKAGSGSGDDSKIALEARRETFNDGHEGALYKLSIKDPAADIDVAFSMFPLPT